jgi:cation-transporting ATPase E
MAIDAMTTDPGLGLTSREVEERIASGQVNQLPSRTSRTYAGIVRSNVFTRFNLIISLLASVVLVVGQPADALFAIVMVVNAVVGVVQEVRAKRTLDRLRILVAPQITVRRDGHSSRIAPETVVVDDLLVLGPGDHVPIDGRVTDDGLLEVDESALTGEADPIVKTTGDWVWSGSAVTAGSARVVAERVGSQTWIHTLVAQAKEYSPATSELRRGVDRILRLVGWIIVPLAALLLWSQLRSSQSTGDALISAVAGVVGLVPQGLVLLVSMALAVAIIRLAREHVVVQELHAVEGLARIDVFCVDKTGTLTTGVMQVSSITPLDATDPQLVRDALAALAGADPDPTTTLRVIGEHVAGHPGWNPTNRVPFSSVRKWSGAHFDRTPGEDGIDPSWVLGAPEILLERVGEDERTIIMAQVDAAAAGAGRVVLLASSGGPIGDDTLPASLTPRATIVLSEQLRPDVAATLEFFRLQDVAVKVISGDSAATASAVAAQAGLVEADRSVDMRTVDVDDEQGLIDLIERTTVFGRVLPEQKRAIVAALQEAGHSVAMTGDGVNDIPALKRADIAVAVDTATAATTAISQLVLLDGRFDRMPHVVAEGRRVIANMERVSKLFVTKTVYAAVFALTIGVSGSVFPFLPRQMSLVSELTIGLPAFVLSFRAADAASRSGYLRRVLDFAVPAGLATAAVTLVAYWLARSAVGGADLEQARTASTIALTVFAFWVLAVLMHPMDRVDLVLLSALIAVFVITLAIDPVRSFYRLDWPPTTALVGTAATVGAGIAVAQTAALGLRRRSTAGTTGSVASPASGS